jgi:hypothetical protein
MCIILSHEKSPLLRSYLFFLLLFLSGGYLEATTWYVKPGGTGTGSGSWANAAASTQLATIIAGAASGDQVWVVGSAGGTTYYPTAGASRTAAFVLTSGVAVYGGFAGTETLLAQRNYATNITILSGDIGISGNNSDNSYHVVVSAANTGTTVLDGFTIEYGNANGAAGNTDNYNGVGFAGDEQTGAGILTYNTTVTISNCIVRKNTATGAGGGVYSYGTTVNYTSCSFSNNTSAADGGGMYINANGGGGYTLNSSSFTSNAATGSGGGLARENGSVTVNITGCSFASNSSAITGSNVGGGGIYLVNNGLTMTFCTISGNSAAAWGGGILYNQGSNAPISYCTISSNSAVYGGGMADLGGSAPLLTNNKFSQNSATYGGGLYCYGAGNPTISIDTFANNTATATSGMAGGGLLDDNGSNSTVSHCWFNGNVTLGGDGAGQYDNSSAGLDSNCVYQANIGKGAASNGAGLYHNGSTGSVINCVFADNSCTGNGGGVYNELNSETYENCTFYNNSSGNSTTGGDGIYVANGTKPHITNDIIWSTNALSVGLVVGSGTPKINYSDIQGQTVAYLNGFGGNNISTAPAFTDAGSYTGVDGAWGTSDDGLHLANGSAGTDAVVGTAPGNFPADDITDAGRPDGGSPNADMGAYEGPGGAVSLSVRQLALSGYAASGVADLSWQVEGLQQSAVFHVQKSTNGTDFIDIAEIPTVPDQTNYAFTDYNDLAPMNYYRLRTVQAGQSDLFSSVIALKGTVAVRMSLRPSIVQQNAATLYILSPQQGAIVMTISDASGRSLMKKSHPVNQGDNFIPIELGEWPKGIYYIAVTGKGIPGQVVSFGKL